MVKIASSAAGPACSRCRWLVSTCRSGRAGDSSDSKSIQKPLTAPRNLPANFLRVRTNCGDLPRFWGVCHTTDTLEVAYTFELDNSLCAPDFTLQYLLQYLFPLRTRNSDMVAVRPRPGCAFYRAPEKESLSATAIACLLECPISPPTPMVNHNFGLPHTCLAGDYGGDPQLFPGSCEGPDK